MACRRKSTFYSALGLEYTARIVGCLEVWLILNVLTTDVSFVGCILIVAFSSLLANLLFFLPMQLGGREGGFALAVAGLSLSGAYGVFAALITRVREMVSLSSMSQTDFPCQVFPPSNERMMTTCGADISSMSSCDEVMNIWISPDGSWRRAGSQQRPT